MAKEYSKPTGCSDANEILKKWLERRKKGAEAEEKILTSLLKDEQIACIPVIAKQLKQFFDTDINSVIQEAIELQIKRDRPHETAIPEEENALMRGKKKVLESAISINELNDKLNDALESMNRVYTNKPDMQNLWTKRLNTARDEVLKKIKRL